MPAGVVAAAEALKEALSGFEPAVFSGEDCARIAEVLASTEKACATARLLASARAVSTGAHKERGFADGAAWVARQSGTTTGRARQELDTAARLSGLAATRDALIAGDISLQQAREITETPAAEKQLLRSARDGDLTHLREAARAHRQARTDPAELRRRQFSLREFRHWQDHDGMIRFTGALPPETGLPLVGRIERAAQRLHRAAKRSGNVERFDKYAADALAQLALHSGGDSGQPGNGPCVDMTIVCDINAYRRGHTIGGEVCHIVGGGPIPVSVVRELAKDAFLKAVIHDGVNIHTVKHFGRHYPAALRTALNLGPPPAFPGRRCKHCGKPFGLQRDHEDPLANGGATEHSNIQDLCYSCHQEKTGQDRKAGRLGPRPPAKPTTGKARPAVQPGLLDTS